VVEITLNPAAEVFGSVFIYEWNAAATG
jgi:hypothetical protein